VIESDLIASLGAMTAKYRLLIVAHAPSPNTQRLRDAVLEGARNPEIGNVAVHWVAPLEAGPDDVLAANAVILGTTENLGYMSGALKDFFDRCYYPCLEKTQGLPYAAWIRGRHDGTGTRRAIESITTGLRWRAVQEPLMLIGDWDEGFVDQCRDLGMAMAAGLEGGIF
jgi:multimeric flavodoxin WrbA